MNKQIQLTITLGVFLLTSSAFAQTGKEPRLSPVSINNARHTENNSVKPVPVLAPAQAQTNANKKDQSLNSAQHPAPQLAAGASKNGIIEQEKK